MTDKIMVSTTRAVRGDGVNIIKVLEIDTLATNVNLFLVQVEKMMQKTPETIGKFQFMEFEVHADISADGQLVLLGTGGKVGIQGGLSFKFQKVQVPVKKETKKK